MINKSPLASRIPEMTRNVLRVYRLATDSANVACIVAALSPQVSWERNLVLLTVFPGGPKVNSFAANLAGDYGSIVTIDAHAAQVALADVLFNKSLPWSPYACIARAYINAAKRIDVAPAHLQAVCWLTWKRIHPPEVKRAIRRES